MDPRLRAFLDLIAWSEGTSTSPVTVDRGYDVIVSGIHGPSVFTDYSKHPFEDGGSVQWKLDPPEFSTAAGRYQLLARYWRIYKEQLGLPDYSPASQDAVALQQMKERGAISLVEADNPQAAIQACAEIWASFPGNDYAQGGKPMPGLLAQYREYLA